jgi:hypothetical protein
MKHIKNYKSFVQTEDFNILEGVSIQDRCNFILIFESLYENHLTINEKNIINSNYGMINESWFSDLVDKGKRGVLKVTTDAGNLLVDLAKKAKDILNFAKTLASKIGEYVKTQFSGLLEKVKNYALKDAGFVQPLIEFIENKNEKKLKYYISGVTNLVTYVVGGKFITDIVDKLSGLFSKVLETGTNEGLLYLDNEFLFENEKNDDDDVKKSFLQRLGDKIKSFPPFSWLPNIEDIMKKGINYVGDMIDRFFGWLQQKTNESINLKKTFASSRFGNALRFLFQILELYIQYKVLGSIEKFKSIFSNAAGLEELTKGIQDKTLDQVWDKIGIGGEEIVNNVKNAAKKIPYVGTILAILDSLVVALGSYLAVEPVIKKILT